MVARHLGHELPVHKKFYRLQEDTVSLAKVSKMLLAIEQGHAVRLKGKSLDDLSFEGRLFNRSLKSSGEPNFGHHSVH